MKVIEADGVRLAHIDADKGELHAQCGANPFPARWEQPVNPTKILCRACLHLRQQGRRRRG